MSTDPNADEPRRLSRTDAEALIAPIAARLATPDAELGIEVDPAVFTSGGAVVRAALAGEDLELPGGPAWIVRGDVALTGTLHQPFGAAPLLVLGDLTARRVITEGYLVVMGELRVADRLVGSASNYGTHVFGAAQVDALLLAKNHVFVTHRSAAIRVRVEDEVDGSGAVERHLRSSR